MFLMTHATTAQPGSFDAVAQDIGDDVVGKAGHAAASQVAPKPPRCKRVYKKTYWIDCDTVDTLNEDGGPSVNGSTIEGLIGSAKTKSILKESDRSRVYLVSFGGRLWVRKRLYSRGLKARLKHWRKKTRVWQEWHTARQLRQLGRRVNSPMLLIHDKRHGAKAQTLVLPYVEGKTLAEFVHAAEPRAQWTAAYRVQRNRLADAIGKQIGELLAADLVNLEHLASKLIVDQPCLDDGVEPVIIPSTGLTSRGNKQQVFGMLAALFQSARDAGDVSPREAIRVMRAILAVQPKLVRGKRRLAKAIKGVASQLK